jgi:hypothetical protein
MRFSRQRSHVLPRREGEAGREGGKESEAWRKTGRQTGEGEAGRGELLNLQKLTSSNLKI